MIKVDFNKQNEKIITITGKSNSFRTNVKDITHIVCDEYVSTVHLINGTKYDVTRLLKCFEESFKDDTFFKVARNTLINTEQVGIRIVHKERSIDINGIIIKASRRRFALLKKKFLYGELSFCDER